MKNLRVMGRASVAIYLGSPAIAAARTSRMTLTGTIMTSAQEKGPYDYILEYNGQERILHITDGYLLNSAGGNSGVTSGWEVLEWIGRHKIFLLSGPPHSIEALMGLEVPHGEVRIRATMYASSGAIFLDSVDTASDENRRKTSR
ncbi:MAG: hypothetical protein AB1640_19760 [bacterium]